MLYYDTIDVSEGIGGNQTSASEECIIFHYFHHALMISMEIKSISSLNIAAV